MIDFPRLLFNTIAIAVIGMIGTVALVHARRLRLRPVPVPRPDAPVHAADRDDLPARRRDAHPDVRVFSKIGWVGTWLPLLVPTFFANAFDVFLLRQYMMTIPREMDEAAAIDGAGPFRTLISVILPQAWPAIIAVAIFHLVYAWNDFFDPLIYLSTKPDLQPLAVGPGSSSTRIHYRNPAYIQAGTLMTMVIPIILFLIFQRVFVRGRRDHRRGGVTAERRRSGSRSRSTPSTPTGRTGPA